MQYVEIYKKKATKTRLYGLAMLLGSILAFIIGVVGIDNFYNDFLFALSIILLISGFLGFCISMFFLLHPKVVWRKYKNDYIIFYNGALKSFLIINDVIQSIGGGFQYDFYGELSDGTQVYAKVSAFSGSVKFAIGDFNNITHSII